MSNELKKEMIGIGLIGLFLFLLVSLVSYHPLDPSFSTFSTGPVKNLCGKVGSYITDALIQVFGMVSYLLPAYTLLFAFFCIRKKDPPHVIILSSGLVLFFVSALTLFQLMVGKVRIKGVDLPFSGFLGVLLEKTLTGLFGYFGSYLISIVIFLISVFLIVQAPILSIIEDSIKRRRSVEKRKQIKVVEEKKEEPKKEKEPVQEAFDFYYETGPYRLPSVSLLDEVEKTEIKIDKESIQANASILEKKLKDYGIEGRVSEVKPGPV